MESPNVMESPRPPTTPEPAVLKRLENTDIRIGTQAFVLKKLRHEYIEIGLEERRAEFEAFHVQTANICCVSLRCQTNTLDQTAEERESNQERAVLLLQYECRTWIKLAHSSHTPNYIAHAEMTQPNGYESPGGYLHAIATSWYPDVELDEVIGDIPRTEVPELKRQLIAMVSFFYQSGYEYLGSELWMYKYDRERKFIFATDIDIFTLLDTKEVVFPPEEPLTWRLRQMLNYIEEETGKNLIETEDNGVDNMHYDAEWWPE